MFINSYCLFHTCGILLCYVGKGPVPMALIFKYLYLYLNSIECTVFDPNHGLHTFGFDIPTSSFIILVSIVFSVAFFL